MDGQNKPNARKKKIVGEGKGIEKQGEGLGTGPVGQGSPTPPASSFQQQASQSSQRPAQTTQSSSKPVQGQGLFGQQASQSSQRPAQSSSTSQSSSKTAQGQGLFGQQASQSSQRPAQTTQSSSKSAQGQGLFGQSVSSRPAQSSTQGTTQRPAQSSSAAQSSSRPTQGQGLFGQQTSQSSSRPAQSAARPTQSASRPAQSTQRPAQSSQASQRPASSTTGSSGGQRSSSGMLGGGGGKIIILLIAVAAIFLFGKNLFGGGDNSGDSVLNTISNVASNVSTQTSNTGTGSGTGGVMNLLSSFLGSTESSAYDFSGILSGLTGGGSSGILSGLTGGGSSGSGGLLSGSGSNSGQNSSQNSAGSLLSQYFTTSMENNTPEADTTVSSKARGKYTVLKGGNQDTMTILLYMCGADLESQNGMATADIKEMLNAKISDKINLIIYTGGASRWRNNVVSSKVNQIYQIKDGSLTCLKDNCGSASMTSPSTLAEFIQFGKQNFPANRMCLIFWDHGGGSVSGYGYDERYGKNQTMTLAGINEALKAGSVKFDFVGFDACLMATLENGLMLEQYADYMIASEETEPGVGWYYTNWLTKLSSNTSTGTVQIGKTITDDFVEVCNKQCRGQATTLSVVDLAELAATVPAELKSFSTGMSELIQNNEYKKVSSARGQTREFAQSSKIDQIDLVHFARNMGTDEGKKLAEALQGAVKYNRTGGGISNAYGLSIYFPYKKTGKVTQAVSTYKAIGMDDEYTRCIQEFASLEVSGQLSAGTSAQSYGSGSYTPSGLLESLMGSGSSYYSDVGSNYSSGGLESLLGGYFGGSSSGSTGSILDLLVGRNVETTARYIQENHFDPTGLVWNNGRITMTDDQWGFLQSVTKKLYYDDGAGYIDMGFDTEIKREGNDLVYEFDGTWLSIDKQPVAYYRTAYIEAETCYVEVGYVPVLLNGARANLILIFDQDDPYGYIAGAQRVYQNGETETVAKSMIAIGKGDKIQAVCDYYDYKGNYVDSYKLGSEFTLGETIEIANTYVNAEKCRIIYCLTDYYQQDYWTPFV